jgi:hypothetical protein
MEAICSSETSVDTPRTTRRYIPEDGALHNHRCENLKSYIIVLRLILNVYYLCIISSFSLSGESDKIMKTTIFVLDGRAASWGKSI